MTSRILVVSDAPDLLALLDAILTSEGYAVETAGTIDDARSHFAALPDLVVGDVRVRGGAPFALMEIIPAHAPLLLLSGDLRTDGERPLRPGVALVPKPFELEQLLGEVYRLLSGAW